MGSVGFSLELRRIGNGDVDELFYELKDWFLDRVWNVTSQLTGFARYLNSENFSTWMSDRYERDEKSLWYAFWEEEVESAVVGYAIHVARMCIASDPDTITALAARHGFAIELEPIADTLHGRFVLHGATRMCTVLPWRRGESVEAMPRFGCDAELGHRGKLPDKNKLLRLRASAMTGLCACKMCNVYRGRPDPLSEMIPRAWHALDSDARAGELAARTRDDPAAVAVLADWLEERSLPLTQTQLDALVACYRYAETMT
jgi:hypothetical protein